MNTQETSTALGTLRTRSAEANTKLTAASEAERAELDAEAAVLGVAVETIRDVLRLVLAGMPAALERAIGAAKNPESVRARAEALRAIVAGVR